MIRRSLHVLLAVGLLSTAGGPPAHAATLSGKLVMGTAGAPLPGGLKVTVVEIAPSGDMGSPQHVPAAPDGSYSFEGDAGLSHLIGTIYQESTYSMIAEPGELPAKELIVYETTQDVSVVEVVSDTMTVIASERENEPDVFEVLQLLRFRNDSDRTYTGETGEDAVLRLPVPESVFDLAPGSEDSAGLAMTPRGLAATVALQPGELSIPYIYKVKVPRSGWQLRREVLYPTRTADLLIGEGLELNAAPGFEFQEKADLGKSYDRYRSESLTPGEVVAADIGFGTASGGKGIWYGMGTMFAVLATALLAAALAMRRRKLEKPKVRASAPAPSRNELIDRVARLDESFDAGGLDPSQYETERSKLVAQLLEQPAPVSARETPAP
ncbi:MAG: hypothetical protein WD627_13280 [Actinomycetota bacterium]